MTKSEFGRGGDNQIQMFSIVRKYKGNLYLQS